MLKHTATTYLAAKDSRAKQRLFGHQMANQRRLKQARLMRNPWEKWEIKLIGTMSDRQVAQKIGRPISTVQHKRNALKIAAHSGYRKWSDKQIEFLKRHASTCNDRKIARQLKLTEEAVKLKRGRLGIKKRPGPLPLKCRLNAKTIKLYREIPAKKLARRLNLPVETIYYRRKALGISAVRDTSFFWTKAAKKMLGTLPDAEVARRLGRTLSSVTTQRLRAGIRWRQDRPHWRLEEIAVLGTMTDRQAARMLGRTENAVTHKRNNCNTPPFVPQMNWTPGKIALLGKRPDQELADSFSVKKWVVSWKRRKLGIAPVGTQVKSRPIAVARIKNRAGMARLKTVSQKHPVQKNNSNDKTHLTPLRQTPKFGLSKHLT